MRRVEQFEHFDRLDRLRDLADRRRIGEVTAHRHVGQQEVVLDQRHEHLDVGRARSPSFGPIVRISSMPTTV